MKTYRAFTSIAAAFACGAAVAAGAIAIISSPAQAISPQGGQQQPGQALGGPAPQKYKVVSFEGKNAQQLQNLLQTELGQGWRLTQMSGNLVILHR